MTKLNVGIDNYSLFPLKLDPMETLKWAKENGAEGVAFSGVEEQYQNLLDTPYLKDLAQYAESQDMYLEWGGAQHIPRDLGSWDKKEILKHNERVAVQAQTLGTRVVRSCSGGLMRWQPDSPMSETLLAEMADELLEQKQMLMDHNVVLAIETHFEFTTQELLKVFDRCEADPGEYIGISLDTMNLLTMLEDPVLATERVLPWVVNTHMKDGGIIVSEEGLTSFTAEIGKGIVDFEKIIRRLSKLDRTIHLSIEDHGGDFSLPIFDPLFLSKFPDLNTFEFARLIHLAHKSRVRMEAGDMKILDRKYWPALCEQRVIRDIQNLKTIRDRVVA